MQAPPIVFSLFEVHVHFCCALHSKVLALAHLMGVPLGEPQPAHGLPVLENKRRVDV